jgi:hydrogenase-4 component B
MVMILAAAAILLINAVVALLLRRNSRIASVFGVAGPVLAFCAGIIPAIQVLSGRPIASIDTSWSMPLGSFSIGLDGLSAFFLFPILGLGALSAIYGFRYLRSYRESKSLGSQWFLFNILIASMLMVVVARNALLFLVAWEAMSLSSFFLVAFENEKEGVREASWIYLIATHFGTAFLIAMFLLLGRGSNGLNFSQLGGLDAELAGLCFIFAVIGFGTKAGIMPFHVWLPEAHPAAPSHVSALMSGVMIKTGIYGILRAATFLGPPPSWWGWMLICIGLFSGVIGVLFALAQHDLKRLLAYSSVENIGIIVTGIGVGFLGISTASPALAVLGFAGSILHAANHSLFKGLLFLGTGSVIHGAHTIEMDKLGGLLKRMPWTGLTFLIGAAAISGLPPLNGFVSEFLIYLGAFKGALSANAGTAAPLLAVIAGLALIGGLAIGCFTKAFGIVFLGEPRSEQPANARESGAGMIIPMLVMAAGCFGAGLLGFMIVRVMPAVLADFIPAFGPAGPDRAAIHAELFAASGYLTSFTCGALALLLLTGLIAWLRIRLLSGRKPGQGPVWDCGYAAPNARMQYTASSFAQPVIDFFDIFHRGRKQFRPPKGYFPKTASFETETLDTSQEGVYRPIFEMVERLLSKMRVMQHGRIQLYVLYIVITLIVLFLWKLN